MHVLSFVIFIGANEDDGGNNYNDDGKATGWKYWDMEDTGDVGDNGMNLKKLRPSKDYDNISKLNNGYENSENEVSDVDPWWERVISNRH